MCKGKRRLTGQIMGKTLELLEILSAGSELLPIGALAGRLSMSRTDTLMLLVTLECHGMVRWDDAARTYGAGYKSIEMARQYLNLHCATAAEQRLPTASRKLKPRPAGNMKLRSTAGLR
jgi:DNA-binding IclR family transcriptional regulator